MGIYILIFERVFITSQSILSDMSTPR